MRLHSCVLLPIVWVVMWAKSSSIPQLRSQPQSTGAPPSSMSKLLSSATASGDACESVGGFRYV